MNSDAPSPSSTRSGSGEDWPTLSNDLLQGLVHALNNRLSALGALMELARLRDARVDPLAELPTEIAQLQGLTGLFALLPERRAEAEALELSAALVDAVRLHEHHLRLRAERCEVQYEGTPAPVRAPRWALVRTFVMLVHAAKRSGEATSERRAVPIIVRSDESTVSVCVSTGANPSPDLLATGERAGGKFTREDGMLVFRMPTLSELRRREREARGERA
jgi:C4-dicarboxylate-specific signal transduction histidine kinase